MAFLLGLLLFVTALAMFVALSYARGDLAIGSVSVCHTLVMH